MEKKTLSWVHYAAIGTGMSATFVGLVAGGYFLGSFMDGKFASYPLWTNVAVLVSLAMGITWMIFTIGKLMKSVENKRPTNGLERTELPDDES